MSKKNYIILVFVLLLAMTIMSGCGTDKTEDANDKTKQDTGFILTGPGSFDSADTSVIAEINEQESTITFLNLTVSKRYTLTYDGTTTLYDRFGQPITIEQLREGNVVDVTFLKSKKKLTSLSLSSSGWSNENISRYTIDTRAHNITIGKDVFKLTKDTMVFQAGQEVEIEDINETDVVSFYGKDSAVLSIVIEKGHGYLRLSGDENFIGGWIEVGQNIIHQITEDMLLTVPEGSYQVAVSCKGGGGTKKVTITKNEETTMDISDFEIEEPKYGQVIFALQPSSASLYIDGTNVDPSGPVQLLYGIHQIIARAEGYSSITRYLKVAEENAGIEITLEKETEQEKETQTSVSSGDNTITSSDYRVYIDNPTGTEVYVDGNYIGICPVSFKKVAGAHVVTLRKTGCETRSYTIQVDNEDKDISYSYADLLAN